MRRGLYGVCTWAPGNPCPVRSQDLIDRRKNRDTIGCSVCTWAPGNPCPDRSPELPRADGEPLVRPQLALIAIAVRHPRQLVLVQNLDIHLHLVCHVSKRLVECSGDLVHALAQLAHASKHCRYESDVDRGHGDVPLPVWAV